MKAVILAGGLGSRLKPFTEIIPKPLLPIGEKSVLEIQINQLKKHGFNEIYLATNYKSEYIENFVGDGSRYNVSLMISKEDKPLGTVGPITLLKEKLTEPFLLMNGDVLTNLDFTKFYIFAKEVKSDLIVSIKEYIIPFAFGNIKYNGDFVTSVQEKPDIKLDILAGIYILKPNIFSLIPTNEFYGIDQLIQKMLKNNIPVAKYTIHEYWLDIGQIPDFEKAQDIYNQHFSQ